MPPAGFEPTISAGQRPQTYALDRAATGIGPIKSIEDKIFREDLWKDSFKIYQLCVLIHPTKLNFQHNTSARLKDFK